MKYWEQMQSKWGFDDGNATPPDARACREAYVRAVNAFAERCGSQWRVIAWDRPGMHNSCLIVSISLGHYETLPEDRRYDGSAEDWRGAIDWPEGSDEQLEEAIRLADEAHVDDAVETVATLDHDALAGLITELLEAK